MDFAKYLDKLINFDLSKHLSHGIINAFAVVGAVYIASYFKVPIYGFYRHFLRPRRNLISRYGSNWALVTGAGDGIGSAYCHELARSGFNIILLSRTIENLVKVSQEI